MNKHFKIIALLVSLTGLSLWGGNAHAAACVSAATGDWRTAATWAAPCNVAGGPTAADTVTIVSPHVVTVGVNPAVTVGGVTVNAGGTLAIAGINFTNNGATNVSGTLSHTNTGGTETYTGLVTINAGGVWDNAIGESVNFLGGLIHNGTSFTSGTLAANGRMSFNASQTIGGASPINFVRVRVNGAFTVTNNNPNVTIIGTLDGTVAGSTWVNGVNSTVNYSNATVPMSTNGVLTATAAGNTFNYNGAAQTAKVTTYNNLTLSGSGAKTFATTPTVNNVLSMEGTATVTVTAGVMTYGANATLQYNTATARTVSAEEWISPFAASGGIIIANTGVITVGVANTLSATAPLTINSGATLATGANVITINGNVNNSGTITSSTGSITLSGGAASHTLSGIGIYGNLVLNDALGATLTGSPTVSGVLTLTSGILTTGVNVLEVTSNCTAGISAGGAATYVQGNLTLHYPINAGTTTCTFPIGSAAAYSPATVAMLNVTSTLANSSLTARTDTPDHADTAANISGVDPAKSVNRYWTLTPGGSLTFATYNITFTFVAGNIDGGATAANFIIARKSSGIWRYPTMGAKNPLNTTASGMTQAGGFGEFVIGERIFPSLTILKIVDIISDPVNGTSNPKYIPGAVAEYTITVINSGGPVDYDSTFITDPIPTNTLLHGPVPVQFSQGGTSSTLTYNQATDLLFFNGSWSSTMPTFDPTTGCETSGPTTQIQINPKGVFIGSTGPNPSFQLKFRVCVK